MSIPNINTPAVPITPALVPWPVPSPLMSDIVPFTNRSGATFAEVFYGYREYLDTNVVGTIANDINKFVTTWNTLVDELVTAVNAGLTSQAAEVVSRLNQQSATVRQELNATKDLVNAQLEAENATFNTRLAQQSATVRQELNDTKDGVTTQLNQQSATVRQELNTNKAYVDTRVQAIIDDSIEVTDPVLMGIVGDNNANFTKYLSDTFGITSKHFGILGNGSDETAKMQAFVNYVTARGIVGRLVSNEIHISDSITVPVSRGWSLEGLGPYLGTNLVMDADNKPIMRLGVGGSGNFQDWKLRNICITYANPQPVTNTNANNIYFESMAFEFEFSHVYFRNGYYGIAYKNGVGGAWGGDWDAIQFRGFSGGWYNMAGTINAVPNNRFGRIFGDAATCQDYLFKQWRGYNTTVDTIEVINYNVGVGLLDFTTSSSFIIGSFKLEGGSFLTANPDIVRIPAGAHVSFGDFEIRASNGGFYGQPSAGTLTLFAMNAGGTSVSTLRIGMLRLAATVLENSYLFKGSQFTSQVFIDRLDNNDGWLTAATASGAALNQNIVINQWMNKRLSSNKGDVNLVVTPGDETMLFFETPLTAPRTVALPFDTNKLIGGLAYRIYVANNVVNGANTLAIMADDRVVYTKTATGLQIITVEWRRNTSGKNGWIVTGVESL